MRTRPIRWYSAWMLASVTLVGCAKPYINTQVDYDFYNRVSAENERANYSAEEIVPTSNPVTVLNPGENKKVWELTLKECKRIALENNKQIAYLGFRPGEAGTVIDQRLAAFDTFFNMGTSWSNSEQQVLNNIQVFGTGRDAITQKLAGGQQAGYGTNSTAGAGTTDFFQSLPGSDLVGFTKRNATGGLSRISYTLDYQNLNPVNVFTQINPSWRSGLTFALEQPLLQGAGVEFNRAQILIARAGQEQAIKEFQANVHTMLRDVEVAYWQIYFAYSDLYSRETGKKQALATWQKEKNKLDVGTAALPDVAQAREQYEFYRGQTMQALNRVLAAERELRRLMGLPPDDDRRIRPANDPTIAAYKPDYKLAVLETMDQRPELAAQRFLIRANELQVMRQKNGILPDLTASASYNISGLDNQFDQSINVLTNNKYTTWVMGIRYRQPIGERQAHAQTQQAQLALSRERKTLDNLEHTYLHELLEAYQNIVLNYEQIQIQKDRREAAAQQLEARFEFYRQGNTTIDVLLQAQTSFADALRDEAQAIVSYNQSLIRWEFAKGTILTHDNIVLMEEGISKMRSKTLEQRKRQWMNALPLPLHPGSQVHGDLIWKPQIVQPLYPDHLLSNPPANASEAVLPNTGVPADLPPGMETSPIGPDAPKNPAPVPGRPEALPTPPSTKSVSLDGVGSSLPSLEDVKPLDEVKSVEEAKPESIPSATSSSKRRLFPSFRSKNQ